MQSINNQIINSKSINTSQMINANETINSKSLNNNIYSLFFEKSGNFIRGVPRTFLMFLIFSILYLSFALEGVFAAAVGGDDETITDGATGLLATQEYIINKGEYFKENVHWVPTGRVIMECSALHLPNISYLIIYRILCEGLHRGKLFFLLSNLTMYSHCDVIRNWACCTKIKIIEKSSFKMWENEFASDII